MGSNEERLVERYLAEQQNAIYAVKRGDTKAAIEHQAVCRGIILGYELYTCNKFEDQITKYHHYSRLDA